MSVEGWALNVSRGGVRAIADATSVEGALEDLSLSKLLELGRELDVLLGDDAPRPAKIVWIQEEPDGAIIGLAFTDVVSDSVPPPMPPSHDDGSHDGEAAESENPRSSDPSGTL